MDMTRVLKLWILGWLAVCAPLLVLLFALDLDVSRSPAWQVGLFLPSVHPVHPDVGCLDPLPLSSKYSGLVAACLGSGGLGAGSRLWRWAGGRRRVPWDFGLPCWETCWLCLRLPRLSRLFSTRLIWLSARCAMPGTCGLGVSCCYWI